MQPARSGRSAAGRGVCCCRWGAVPPGLCGAPDGCGVRVRTDPPPALHRRRRFGERIGRSQPHRPQNSGTSNIADIGELHKRGGSKIIENKNQRRNKEKSTQIQASAPPRALPSPGPFSPSGSHEVGNKSPPLQRGKIPARCRRFPRDAPAPPGQCRAAGGADGPTDGRTDGRTDSRIPGAPDPAAEAARGAPSFHGARKVRPAGAERAARRGSGLRCTCCRPAPPRAGPGRAEPSRR